MANQVDILAISSNNGSVTTRQAFTEAVRRRHKAGLTYARMEALTWDVGGKEGSRSSAWWNNMANHHMDTPPAPKYFPGIAKVLDVPERRVAEMVAEQWYGVRSDDPVPPHLQSILAALKGVERADLGPIEQLVKHLADQYTSIHELEEQLKNRLTQQAEPEAVD